ncbi:receptor-like kinase, partial [Trifolium pratense]
MSMEIDRCEQTHLDGWTRRKDIIFIGWKQPQEEWFKLNCDGAHKSSIHLSGRGGLLRKQQRYLSRRHEITHLQMESDSKVLVDMVTRNCKLNGRIPTLIKHIHALKNLDWHVEINHSCREGNRPAD